MKSSALLERDMTNESETKVHRILVVDDESSISELISTSLKFVGFDVRTAATGAEALRVAEQFKPHALVLDVMLPDLDGFSMMYKYHVSRQRNIDFWEYTRVREVTPRVS